MDYQPPTLSETDRAIPSRHAMRLESSLADGLRDDPRPAALWLRGPAAKRLALGAFQWTHPFALCSMAAREARPDALDLLLDLGFAPGPETPERDAPDDSVEAKWQALLHLCAHKDLCGSIERLAKTLPIDLAINDGITPLMTAASSGSDAAGLLLLRLGADPHARAADGSTPLMSAAMGNCGPLADALLSLGADLRHAADDGLSAIDHAHYFEATRFLAMLEALDLRVATPSAPPSRRASL